MKRLYNIIEINRMLCPVHLIRMRNKQLILITYLESIMTQKSATVDTFLGRSNRILFLIRLCRHQ